MCCTGTEKRRSFRFTVFLYTAELPPERAESPVNVEAKGRYQVQKRITQHEQLRVIFGLMPAFGFIKFFQIRNASEKQNVKKVA